MKPIVEFANLVGNGFDFLKKSMEEFDKEPKFSVIHFYSALELFLKARLLKEHWTLILTKPDQGDLGKFKAGNFHSINLDDAERRLRDILQEGLTAEEIRCFRELRDHRNRMVHFYHSGAAAKKSEIDAIVSQQCRGWYYLHGLLTARWKTHFAKYQVDVSQCDKGMRKQRKFLKTRFDDLSPEIAKRKVNGSAFHKCPSCGFRALEEDSSDPPSVMLHCMVCAFERHGINIECPHCGHPETLMHGAWEPCSSCGKKITDSQIKTALLDWYVATKDNMYDIHEASCCDCQGHLTVVQMENGRWMCSACFSNFDESQISTCQWCDEPTTEDTDESYYSGCEHCEGYAGTISDND